MIPLHRERSAQVISDKFRGAKKKRKDLELLKAYREVLRSGLTLISFQAAFWKTAKAQLIKESGGKCAYCEANTDVVAHGDVEHYRPKSTYWWLAYTYDNYLYACQICNQIYKSDHFPVGSSQLLAAPSVSTHSTDAELQQLVGLISPDPLATDTEYSLQRYEQEHEQEKALLLNPYFDDPQEYFAYQADDLTQEVIIIPAKPMYLQQVKAAEDFYGLNRIELKNFRYKIYKTFQVMKHSLSDLKDEVLRAEVQQQLQAMQADKYLFAGMNRYFNTKF
jgi:uncharacterized protein (TIGR02646 family)